MTHGGGAPGYTAEWTILPEAGIGVFMLVGADWWTGGYEVHSQVLDALVDLDFSLFPEPPEPSTMWAHFEGNYEDPHTFGDVRVYAQGGSLMADFARAAITRELEPIYGDVYSVEHPAAEGQMYVTFWRDGPDADATYLVSLYGVAARN